VFIPHDVEAVVVPETEFFALSSAGGTRCSTAYQLAFDHLHEQHPASHWNTYLLHIYDGDNLPADNATCKGLIEALLDHCRMVGYSEIRYQDDASFYGWTSQTASSLSLLQNVLQAIEHPRFLSAMIRRKEDLYPALQTFLQPQESAHV
jgi:uncharacterized sporulation protein YeaH/YhbH (DUF444 family)